MDCVVYLSLYFPVSGLINKSLPWNYNFNFVVEEIANVNDKAQVSKEKKINIYYIIKSFIQVSFAGFFQASMFLLF